ncbi:hypothetical protein BpHYR1_007952 [Brachionus plicatilis]|uniref:Uncharacterized protein n=1 Tax=Brachionus plicatilis TaxID=10195 RepID=A0A3M7RCN4_BRAPC|nr:hypothetical protein BpHYR1_007952 [Brachionus plicatilis]
MILEINFFLQDFEIILTAFFHKLYKKIGQLERTAWSDGRLRRKAWSDGLVGRLGRTAWSDGLVGRLSRTSKSDGLVGRLVSFIAKMKS